VSGSTPNHRAHPPSSFNQSTRLEPIVAESTPIERHGGHLRC
jgi:hypothetical protein